MSVTGTLPVLVMVTGMGVESKVEPTRPTVGRVIEVQPTAALVQAPLVVHARPLFVATLRPREVARRELLNWSMSAAAVPGDEVDSR